MTTADRYSVLTRIGPGTPMGQYMRFFWHPIAAVAELKDHPKPVRIDPWQLRKEAQRGLAR